MNLALEGVDSLGFRLDQLGITSRVNRHNIAAFLMAEQKHLEGEWDSIQARWIAVARSLIISASRSSHGPTRYLALS